jgi:flagellar protein FlgJ
MLRGTNAVSIKPPSDLLLDVVRAADPATSAAAAARLARIAAGGGKSDVGFSDVLNGVEAPQSGPTSSVMQRAGMAMPLVHSSPVNADKKAYQGLEALLLQNLVETMLPKGSDLFGEGSAGMIWRSMLARELGTDLAKKVDLGIQPKYLRAGRALATEHGKTSDAAATPVSDIRHVVPKRT